MGAYLSSPVRDTISADKSIDKLSYGASSMQGWRVSQEDAHNCLPEFDANTDTAFFAVYDGHGGSEVAQYAALELPGLLQNLASYHDDVTQALSEAFLAFDERLKEPEVVRSLKEIAGVQSDVEEEEEEGKDDGCPVSSTGVKGVRNEAALLCEEASMPLEQLMQRYAKTGTGPRVNANIPGCSKFQSPMIRAKYDSRITDIVNGDDNSASLSNGDSKRMADNIAQATESHTNNNVTTAKEDTGSAGDGENSSGGAGDKEDSRCADVSSSSNSGEVAAGGSGSNAGNSRDGGGGSAGADDNSSFTEVTTAEEAGASSKSDDGTVSSSSGLTDYLDDSSDSGEQEWQSSEAEDDDDDDSEEEEDDEEVISGCVENEDEAEDCGIMGGNGEPGNDSGCTAVVAVLRARTLYVANSGDSRAVLCRAGQAVDMSMDHKPEDTPERQRIMKAGGRVTFDGRVNGGLNLSRALGDHCYKKNGDLPAEEQMITALPDVKSIALNDDDEFMVLACDGIWNVMSSQDAVNFVRDRLKEKDVKLSAICEQMFELCLAPDTTGDGTGCDNMTCIIIRFHKLDDTIKPTAATAVENCSIDSTDCDKNAADDDTSEKMPKRSADNADIPTCIPESKKARTDVSL